MRNQPLSLDVIDVKQPCPASWEAMRGDDRTRFCEGCGKHVHNLSGMTRAEAAALVGTCAAAGALCVRFARAEDGVVQTLDYRPAALRRGRGWRFWATFGACLASGVAAVNAVVFRNALPPPFGRPPPPVMVMGDIAPLPVPPNTGCDNGQSDAPPSEDPQATPESAGAKP